MSALAIWADQPVWRSWLRVYPTVGIDYNINCNGNETQADSGLFTGVVMFNRVWHGRLGGLRLIMMLATAALVLVGLANIYAATGPGHYTQRQLIWIGIGIVAFVLVSIPHYRHLVKVSYGLYALALALLVFVLVGKYVGLGSLVPPINGSYRWIALGPVRLQPSELAKLAYILALGWFFRQGRSHRRVGGLIRPFALALVPMALILFEPDLGTVLLFVPVLFAVLFAAGARVRHLLTVVFAGIVLAPIMYFTPGALESYQRDRVKVLFKQGSEDPYWQRGPGYQLAQSKTAIGSGRLTGHGWRKGSFIRYRFLPHRHNDFIFALIGHQWGFVGSVVVLALYALITLGGIEIAGNQVDPCGRVLAVGITTLFAVQMFINVGVTIGLMPVTGMTLPFVSYGGSSLLASFLGLGLLVNVARHRPHQLAPDPFEFDE